MNWVLLVVGGLFETAFAFCIGKAKEVTGLEMYFWYAGFIVSVSIGMGLFDQGGANPAYWDGLCGMDRHRCSRFRVSRDIRIQRPDQLLETVFYHHAYCLNRWA